MTLVPELEVRLAARDGCQLPLRPKVPEDGLALAQAIEVLAPEEIWEHLPQIDCDRYCVTSLASH